LIVTLEEDYEKNPVGENLLFDVLHVTCLTASWGIHSYSYMKANPAFFPKKIVHTNKSIYNNIKTHLRLSEI
jgi:hypothetical protein